MPLIRNDRFRHQRVFDAIERLSNEFHDILSLVYGRPRLRPAKNHQPSRRAMKADHSSSSGLTKRCTTTSPNTMIGTEATTLSRSAVFWRAISALVAI